MLRLARYHFADLTAHANRWHAAANSWNTEGVRGAKWPGYIVVREREGLLVTYYYVNRPQNTGVLLAKIDTLHNKLEEV